MSFIGEVAPAVSWILATSLLGIGFVFITNPARAFVLSGHEAAALPSVMGGRYFALGAFIIGLMLMSDYSALSLAFAIGAGLGLFDAFVTAKVGGSPRGHFVVGLIAAALSVYYFAAGSALEV